MTDRPREDRVDTEYGERSSGQHGSGSAPRRVSEIREERERGGAEKGGHMGEQDRRSGEELQGRRSDEHDHRSSDDRSTDRGTSWTSVIFGWLAALGASLILSGIVGGIVGGILGALGVGGSTEGGVAGLVGLLVTLFLAFLIGGYVAGRLASRSGVKHGLLVPLLALVVVLLLALIGGAVGYSFIDQLSGVTLPQVPQGAQQQAPQNLGTILTVSGILALLVPFVGGAIGGSWGARTGRRRP